MEGVEQSFGDITSRQFVGEITMQIQLSMEMQVQEGGMIVEGVIKLIQLRRTYRDYGDNLPIWSDCRKVSHNEAIWQIVPIISICPP
jgi:glycerol-3-phosphate dehydrogenase